MQNKIQILDYSQKAIAVVGETKPIKEELKNLGGKFNPRLKCGAGWVFSKKRKAEVEALLTLPVIKPQPQKVHWLYAQAQEDKVSTASISKWLREQAKAMGVKASVRKEHYGSILIEVLESSENVEAFIELADMVEGKGFDGSIDMEYYYYHAINQEGVIKCLGTSGTVGSRGYVPNTLEEAPKGFINLSTYTYVRTTKKY